MEEPVFNLPQIGSFSDQIVFFNSFLKKNCSKITNKRFDWRRNKPPKQQNTPPPGVCCSFSDLWKSLNQTGLDLEIRFHPVCHCSDLPRRSDQISRSDQAWRYNLKEKTLNKLRAWRLKSKSVLFLCLIWNHNNCFFLWTSWWCSRSTMFKILSDLSSDKKSGSVSKYNMIQLEDPCNCQNQLGLEEELINKPFQSQIFP